MIKSVIKEIVIILLLSITIVLLLGVLFYEYIPINKVIPEKEAYITPEEVKNEIEEEIIESEKVEVTYEVTDSDLNIYKQSGSYLAGKSDPFALTSEIIGNIENVTNENSNSETIDKNSTETFFNDEGIK